MNFVCEILYCRLAVRNFAYKILRRRLAASKFANKIAIFCLQRVIFYAKSPFHACKKQFCSQDCTLQIGFYEFCSRDSMLQACSKWFCIQNSLPQAYGKEFLSQDCHYTLAARDLSREIACGRTQTIADLHKGHAACKLAEELVKPLLCCLLETLLKVPQPKHGG